MASLLGTAAILRATSRSSSPTVSSTHTSPMSPSVTLTLGWVNPTVMTVGREGGSYHILANYVAACNSQSSSSIVTLAVSGTMVASTLEIKEFSITVMVKSSELSDISSLIIGTDITVEVSVGVRPLAAIWVREVKSPGLIALPARERQTKQIGLLKIITSYNVSEPAWFSVNYS